MESMRTLAAGGAAALALLVLFATFGAGGGVAQETQPAETFHVELQPDGDAEWTVTVRFDLNSTNSTDGFDRLATEFENGESDELTADPFREAANQASDVTERPMDVQDVRRNAWRSNGTGRLELSFRWTAFARQSGDRLLLGDVFQTRTGTWLPHLDEEQELIVEFPDGFVVVDSSHKLENRAFEIRGPESFDPGMPSATLVRGRATTTAPDTSDGTTDPQTNVTTEPPVRGDWDVVGVGALVVLLGTLALLVERRRRTGGDAVSADGGDGAVGGGAETLGAAGAGAAAGTEADVDETEDEPLLSDDERVLRLLHEHDGRMKQGQIVEETGWSNAKVSQLLSEMAEGGQVDKLRIGRENLISLPGQGPDEDG